MTRLALALALLACSSAPELRTIRYCDQAGARCLDRDDAPDDGTDWQELNWCCPYDGGPCVLVAVVTGCDPEGEYLVICDWGASMPDGSIECYE